MQLKTVEFNGATYAEVRDGRPVYIADDGQEIPFDAVKTQATIGRLNAEAKGHREAKEKAESALKAFEGIEPEKAHKAMETLRNLDDKKLLDAGEVERVKREAKEAFDLQVKAIEKQYDPVVKERDALKTDFEGELLGGAFSRSKFIAERMAIPPDLVQARFGSNFRVGEGRKIQAVGPDGGPIYSRLNGGEVADFDEALEIMVNAYPHREHILKGTGAAGGGAGSFRTGAGGKRQYTRAQFDAMDDVQRNQASKEAAAGKAEIVD